MKQLESDVLESIRLFEHIANLAGIPLRRQDIKVEFLAAPHLPPRSLPAGHMALYAFWGDGAWLKIGLAGPKTKARYTSHHYKAGRAPSTLAASLHNDPRIRSISGFDSDDAGTWIKSSCHRINITIPESYGRPMLALFEAFLHVRLNPRYERAKRLAL